MKDLLLLLCLSVVHPMRPRITPAMIIRKNLRAVLLRELQGILLLVTGKQIATLRAP